MKRNLVVCLFLLLAFFFVTGCPTAKPTSEPTNRNEPDAKKTSDVAPDVIPAVASDPAVTPDPVAASDVATERVSAGNLTIEYKDATYPFRFKIPVGWQYMEKYKNAVVMAFGPINAQGHFPNVNVRVAKADPNVLNTPQGDFETMMKRQLANYNLLTFETSKFGNYDALHIKSTYTPAPDLSVTQEQFMFNAGEFAYVITCSQNTAHYEDHEQAFESILSSFEFE